MKKKIAALFLATVVVIMLTIPASASAGGNVSGVIEQTWESANSQIKEVVNNVVFPALSLVLVVAFFVKVATAYFDYRKHGQFEWAAPAILFVCLVFSLLAPQFIWQVIGV
jgi:type IV secretory pathway VirB2 component (pilin)